MVGPIRAGLIAALPLTVALAACGTADGAIGADTTLAGGTDTTSSGKSIDDTAATGASNTTASMGTSTGTGDDHDADATTGMVPPREDGPTYYPVGRVHSPITFTIAEHLRSIASTGRDLAPDVFMKVGASSEASLHNLYCFADRSYDLGRYDGLLPTLMFFAEADAAGGSPFSRRSEAAEAGRSATWVVAGDPSPLQMEIDTLAPSVALIHFGTNDMELGITPASALSGFYVAMTEVVEQLQEQGIVPVLIGISRRGDDADAQRWVATYNAVIRGLAQQHQVPFVDLYEAVDPLPGHGLGSDGLHLAPAPQGACMLDAAGLEYGFNVRNLIQLEALDRTTDVLLRGTAQLDESSPDTLGPPGSGAAVDPIIIDRLPFADARDTAVMGVSGIDSYPVCDDADESGPELVYRLDIDQPTALRMVVLDETGVDVDLQLLGNTLAPYGCLDRADTWLATTLEPGTYHLVVDTWASDFMPLSGPYLLLVVPCDTGDEQCTGAI